MNTLKKMTVGVFLGVLALASSAPARTAEVFGVTLPESMETVTVVASRLPAEEVVVTATRLPIETVVVVASRLPAEEPIETVVVAATRLPIETVVVAATRLPDELFEVATVPTAQVRL